MFLPLLKKFLMSMNLLQIKSTLCFQDFRLTNQTLDDNSATLPVGDTFPLFADSIHKNSKKIIISCIESTQRYVATIRHRN